MIDETRDVIWTARISKREKDILMATSSFSPKIPLFLDVFHHLMFVFEDAYPGAAELRKMMEEFQTRTVKGLVTAEEASAYALKVSRLQEQMAQGNVGARNILQSLMEYGKDYHVAPPSPPTAPKGGGVAPDLNNREQSAISNDYEQELHNL